jgi:hypothetical protein
VLTAVTIEQGQRGAGLQAHHVQVMGDVGR